MAETISTPAHGQENRSAAHQERLETSVADLIEYTRHNVERPASKVHAEEAREAFRTALTEILKEFNLAHIEEVVEHLEQRLRRGEHDLVVEFLSNLAKLQHADFAQEFLRIVSIPLSVQVDSVLQREVPLLGHTAIASYDSPSSKA